MNILIVFVITSILYQGGSTLAEDNVTKKDEDKKEATIGALTDKFKNSDVFFSVGQSTGTSTKNGMEDKFEVSEDRQANQFFAVFDGHGGSYASSYLQKNAYRVLVPIITKYVSDIKSHNIMKDEIKSAIVDNLDNGISEDLFMRSGSTLCIVINTEDYLISVNVGDSRAVMMDVSLQTFALTEDHKPHSPAELERILNEDSFVTSKVHGATTTSKIQGFLDMSRSMGDKYLKTAGGLISEPDVFIFPKNGRRSNKNEPALIIVASEGVWNVMNNYEATRTIATEICSEIPPQSEADLTKIQATKIANGVRKVIESSRSRRSHDDITIVTASLKPKLLCDRFNRVNHLKEAHQ